MYGRDSEQTRQQGLKGWSHWGRHQLRTAVVQATLQMAFCDEGAALDVQCVGTVCGDERSEQRRVGRFVF